MRETTIIESAARALQRYPPYQPSELVYAEEESEGPRPPVYRAHSINIAPEVQETPLDTLMDPYYRPMLFLMTVVALIFACVVSCLLLLSIAELQLSKIDTNVMQIASQIPQLYSQIQYVHNTLDRTASMVNSAWLDSQQANLDSQQGRRESQATLAGLQYNVSVVADAFVAMVKVLQG